MSDPALLTATEALRRIRAGGLSPVALMEACAAAAARPGPLHGLPVGVKDVLDTADMPSGGYGSPIWEGWRPRADAACVAWTRAAGGVILGKTVTTEFATRQPGSTTNPHNPAHTPGGSSSGSAAGVGAGGSSRSPSAPRPPAASSARPRSAARWATSRVTARSRALACR